MHARRGMRGAAATGGCERRQVLAAAPLRGTVAARLVMRHASCNSGSRVAVAAAPVCRALHAVSLGHSCHPAGSTHAFSCGGIACCAPPVPAGPKNGPLRCWH